MKLSLALIAVTAGSASAWTMSAGTPSGKSRRGFFAKSAAVVAASVPAIANAYAVPDLPYPFEGLEPYIDAPTMKIHHDKHHATYVANINKATEGKDEVPILDLMENALDAGPIRNSGGGHYNHAFFWEEMAPPDQAKKSKCSDQLEKMINKSFGSMDEMKEAFEAKAAPGATFGSGWVWVAVNKAGDELKIVNTANQDNPLMKGVLDEGVMFPILGLDVWEHAYYLKYQNRRPEYVSNWWNVVNWDKVSENCAYVVKEHAGVNVKG